MGKFLQLALNDKKEIVSIYRVPTGEKCNCTCPECGEELIAKNKGKSEGISLEPNQKIAHFAHSSGKVCEFAGETAIHLLAKEVIKKNKRLKIYYEVQEEDEFVLKKKITDFDEVETEKFHEAGENSIKPDATLKKGNSILFIEFYKTHKVDEKKGLKIEKIGISTLELDINSLEPLINGEPNYEGVQFFLENYSEWKWVLNSKHEEIQKQKRELKEFLLKEQAALLASLEHKTKFSSENEAQLLAEYIESEKRKQARIHQWQEKTRKKGYTEEKVYTFGYERNESVYCPKEKRGENRKAMFHCYQCEFHYKTTFFGRDTFVFCGFKNGLKPPKSDWDF